MSQPTFPVFILGNKGYLYDPEGAIWLRKHGQFMGNLVGGVAQFKNQNEVNFLPLELSEDEVTLALQKGWVSLQPHTCRPQLLGRNKQQGRKRRYLEPDIEEILDYHERWDEHGGFGWGYVYDNQTELIPDTEHSPTSVLSSLDASEAAWQVALADGTSYTIPLTAQQAKQQQQVKQARSGGSVSEQPASEHLQVYPHFNSAFVPGPDTALPHAEPDGEPSSLPKSLPNGQVSKSSHQHTQAADKLQPAQVSQSAACSGSQGTVQWSYPSTPKEKLRYAVFWDLHSRGFTTTGGSKFGAELLAYPGDVSLYHAQFTVRLIMPGQCLVPMMLKASARGSHAARKHLLLATVADMAALEGNVVQQPPKPMYVSIAPEAGFGSKA